MHLQMKAQNCEGRFINSLSPKLVGFVDCLWLTIPIWSVRITWASYPTQGHIKNAILTERVRLELQCTCSPKISWQQAHNLVHNKLVYAIWERASTRRCVELICVKFQDSRPLINGHSFGEGEGRGFIMINIMSQDDSASESCPLFYRWTALSNEANLPLTQSRLSTWGQPCGRSPVGPLAALSLINRPAKSRPIN